MKVDLETVVSYFPEKIVRKDDLSYLDAVVPDGQEEVFRQPDEFKRLAEENV